MTSSRNRDAHEPNDSTSPSAHASNVESGVLNGIIATAIPATMPLTTSSLFAEDVTCAPTAASNGSEASPRVTTLKPSLLPPGLKPYYEHNGIAIIHGDCREVAATGSLAP